MDIVSFDGEYPEDEFEAVKKHWDDYDFFFTDLEPAFSESFLYSELPPTDSDCWIWSF